jgi:hypothetical protein
MRSLYRNRQFATRSPLDAAAMINPPDPLRALAEKLAHSLSIPIYIRNGGVYQTGPGVRVDPPPSAAPLSHGAVTIAAKETAP